MDSIDKLAEIFKEFPGIGERQAKRFVYFLMARNGDYAINLSKLILDLKKEVMQCKECFKFFVLNGKKEKLCEVCSDAHTDPSILMVVEKDSDLESVKKSRIYHGKYFILGGLVPIVEKTTKSRVRIEELKGKIKDSKELKKITEPLGIKISSLGRGLSTGTELEYSDNDTLKNALKNRQ